MNTEHGTRQKQERFVSVDLQDNEDNRPLVEAILAVSEDAEVQYFPGIAKVISPTQIVIDRDEVEERMGREWETHEFQMAIISLAGNITEWDDDEIVIEWSH